MATGNRYRNAGGFSSSKYCLVLLLYIIILVTNNFSLFLQHFPSVKGSPTSRFRLGVSVPSNVVRGFGAKHGVTIDLNYEGGRRFYDYMTKGPGFFSYIDFAIRLYKFWGGSSEREFIRGMLDKADEEGGKVEISIKLYGLDLGWPGWEPYLYLLLEAIGSSRVSMRYIFLAGEWSYKDKVPPDWDDLYTDFQKAKQIVNSYGYELGWSGEGKYLTNIPTDRYNDFYALGPRKRAQQVSRDPNCTKGAQRCYEGANWWERPNDVFLEAFTMWDREANIPNTPPYYICYDKFKEFIHGAADRFDASGGVYPQAVCFEIMPETFNDVEGVECPYLEWWREFAEMYNLMIYNNAVKVREPPTLQPPNPFPPYPIGLKYENDGANLPPFSVEVGSTFKGSIIGRNEYTRGALSNREVEVYLIKRTPRAGGAPWYPLPITKEEWSNMILVGKVWTRSDGWAPKFTMPAPLEPGYYTVIAYVPASGQEMEAFSDVLEGIWVVEKAHKVEIRSNIKAKLKFGPTAYGPPWQNCDPERWVEPDSPVVGNCAEEEWKFIMPSQVTDSQGKTWVFSHWEDGSTNPVRTIFVDRDLILEAHYWEPGAKSKINVYGYVRDDRGYPLEGASVTVSSPVDQISAVTNSQGGYTVTLSVKGSGDTVGVTAAYHGRSGSASGILPDGSSSMQINVTVPRASTSISCSVSPSTVTIGGGVTISGTILPAVEGAIVTLTYNKPDGSTSTHNVTTSSSGSYSATYTPDKTGTYSVQASWAGNDDYKGATSGKVSFTVTKKPSSISILLSSTNIVVGERIDIRGIISPAIARASVTISYRESGGSWSTITTVSTDSNGGYSYSWINTLSSEGRYELRASWPGDDYHEGSSCSILFTLVKPPEPDFLITIDKPYLVLTIGEPAENITATLYSENGFYSDVSLSVSESPEGTIVDFLPSSLALPTNGRVSSIIRLRASWNSSPGDYTLQLVASGGGKKHVVDIGLKVVLPAPKFSVSVKPKIITIPRLSGYNVTVAVTVSSLSNYTIEPSLKVSGIPEGIKAKLSQETLRVQSQGSGSTSLIISIGESPPEQGNYSILVECSCGDVIVSELVTLNVIDKLPTFLVANVTPTSIQYGDTILINGSVSPPRQANILVTMMLKNGTEINMTTFSTNETGEFSHIVRIMLAPDEYIIRVLCKEDFFYFGSTFNLTLRVMRASVTITLSSNSTRASSGEPVFFSGIVTTINGEPIKNMDLTILVSGETGTISVPAKTNENGTYAAIISRLSPGKYDAVSLIDDNNYYEPARSTPIKIEVLHPASRILNDILYPFVSIALIILALITSVRVIVSTAHEIRRERNYRVNRIRHKKKPY